MVVSRKAKWAAFAFTLTGVLVATFIYSQRFRSPSILVIGDSQISFGSGRVFMEFFKNFEANCNPAGLQKDKASVFGERSFGAIGVRSSSLHTWVAKADKGKAMICEVDKKWGVNAGVYGISDNPDRKYVQIGQGEEYQFCKKDRSPFEAMFNNKYYNPEFLLMAFLGNSAERWGYDATSALRDVTATMKQIPADIPCVFMTTTPSYDRQTNNLRQEAQSNVKTAFEKSGSRCDFVEGFTHETRVENEGNSLFFTRNKEGVVTDPLHPNIAAQRKFFEIKKPDLCHAVLKQLES